jgi:hypothetical protein
MFNPYTGLLRLLIAHFLISLLFSYKSIHDHIHQKRLRSIWLYLASLLYSLFLYLVIAAWASVWIIALSFLVYLFVRLVKSWIKSAVAGLIFSQVVLLFSIFVIWTSTGSADFSLIVRSLSTLWRSDNTLLIVLGFILVLWPTGPVIGVITEPFREQLDETEKRGLAKAGLWIGCFERIIIYIFVLSGNVTAIAFLVTAKSIFRFGEIKEPENRKEAEYILIGTFCSFSVAMLVGYLIKGLLR